MNRRTFLAASPRMAVAIGLGAAGGCASRDRRMASARRDGEEPVSELARLIPGLMTEAQVPGCSLAVIDGGRVIWTGEFGVKDAVTREPVSETTVFEAASVSKTVFAYAVMKLAERGVLGLDVPLSRYSARPFLEGDSRLELISARRVLSHTGGFQDWRSSKDPLRIHFQPGEQFLYSGEGYYYLQSVVTHLVGREFPGECSRYEADLLVCATDIDDSLKHWVLGPLGMTSSGYVWNDLLSRQSASPHDHEGRPLAKKQPTAADAARYASAGGLHTTPTDYSRFLLGILEPGPADDFRLTRTSLAEMVRPQVRLPDNVKIDGATAWGLGWAIRERSSGKVIVHSGGQAGFQSLTMASIQRKSGFVMLTNSDNGWKIFHHPEFERIMNRLLAG